jgi:Spy/CpxP family protein refolding chaperone
MKRMTLISLALASAITCGSALAQPAPGNRHDPEAHLRNLSVLLELSPAQQSQLRNILEVKRADRAASREQGREAREQMRAERRADREAFEQEIAAILNVDQQAKFNAIKAERRAQQEKRRAMRQQRGDHDHG